MTAFGNTIEWKVPLSDKIHIVKFEHGTTSGRRVIIVDNKEIKREDFMFKLVGTEYFNIGKSVCKLEITTDISSYKYELTVNGQTIEDFVKSQSKVLNCWLVTLDNRHKGDSPSLYRIVLEKDTFEVLVNGQLVETMGEFTDNGTSTHFSIDGHCARIETFSSGNKHSGMLHQLFVDDNPINESTINDESN